MKNKAAQPTFNIGRMINKFLLSGFVVFSFIAYVINQRITRPDANFNSSIATPPALLVPPPSPTLLSQAVYINSNMIVQTSTAMATPTLEPTATAENNSLYKDGVYTGPLVDAYYGYVEVQATIKNGQIADVQFLQYPSDRRTSRQINSIAMPYLQQEAIQAQSANVNVISGATFTSRGFAMSLNEALKSAKK